MMKTMADSHAAVCPVTIFDEADISGWATDEDISVRLVRAITFDHRAVTGGEATRFMGALIGDLQKC